MFSIRHRWVAHVRRLPQGADPGTTLPAATSLTLGSSGRRPSPRHFDSARLQRRRSARFRARAAAKLKAFAPWSAVERPDFAIPFESLSNDLS